MASISLPLDYPCFYNLVLGSHELAPQRPLWVPRTKRINVSGSPIVFAHDTEQANFARILLRRLRWTPLSLVVDNVITPVDTRQPYPTS